MLGGNNIQCTFYVMIEVFSTFLCMVSVRKPLLCLLLRHKTDTVV